ncbi:MAG: hypothetical protein AAGN15_15770 [Cyanobacteria bacterium J06581_3]
MTIKLCGKALAKALLASTLLIATSTGIAKAKAPLNGLTGEDLLAGQVSHSLSVDQLGTVSLDSSTYIAQIVEQSVAQTPTSDTFSPLSTEEIRQQLLIDPNATFSPVGPRPVPASSFRTPTAYGADWGDAYIGIAGSTAGNTPREDGSISLGFGLGDAQRNIGAEISVGIYSLDGFADDGGVGFKLHRVFPEANNLGIAVGWSNPITWGAGDDAEDTFYGVVTKRFDLAPNSRSNRLPLTTSIGVGTGVYRSTGAIAAGSNDPNIFGSLGLRVIPEVSLISSWDGSGLGLAASTAPFDFPMVLTLGVADITDNTSDGTQFQGSLGYSFSF